ncbi:hypothetical protein L914_08931, partial [Phytophthora nicotianae]
MHNRQHRENTCPAKTLAPTPSRSPSSNFNLDEVLSMYVMNASGSASTTSPPVASKLLVLEARVDRLFQQFDNLRQLLAGTASPPEAFAAEIPTYLPVTTNAMLKDINPNNTMRLEENLDGHPGRQGTHNEVLRLARE